MSESNNKCAILTTNTSALESSHQLLMETLRDREQAIVQYLSILGPALAGFVWLLHSDTSNAKFFIVGTIGVLLSLLLGAIYSLALGYNYRYLILELAKLEAFMKISDIMLVGWPRSKQDFLNRYKLCRIPWCTPPEIIKVFWWAFLAGIIGVSITAWIYKPEKLVLWLVLPIGVVCLLVGGLLTPIRLGLKLKKLCDKEPESWDI